MWVAIAGAAQLALFFTARLGYPYDSLVHQPLIGVAYGLMLPAIAVLHVRHRRVRGGGAVLATVAGTAAVAVGIAGSVDDALRPAAIFVAGMWWWTMGKMWVETGVMGRALGLATAALGAAAIAVALLGPLTYGLATAIRDFPDDLAWTAARLAFGVWSIALAGVLGASRDVPSP